MMKKIKIEKVRLSDFMGALKDIYDSGVDYIDIIGVRDIYQDTLVVEVRDDYIRDMELDEDKLNRLI